MLPLSLPSSFIAKKSSILEKLGVPDTEYDDLSPKGSVDEGIKELIGSINSEEGWVTTSSCAGRVSVFLEGKRNLNSNEYGEKREEEEVLNGEGRKAARIGGKGGGGKWLFCSHDPVPEEVLSKQDEQGIVGYLGMERDKDGSAERILNEKKVIDVRFIHFKFEPMILHVLTSSPKEAQTLLSSALQAGFRESGALNITPSPQSTLTIPMVGIRSMGLALESVVGIWDEERDRAVCMAPEWQLLAFVRRANERFGENERRIGRFRRLLEGGVTKGKQEKEWESKENRAKRMREEGLLRKGKEGGREARSHGLGGDLDMQLSIELEDNQ